MGKFFSIIWKIIKYSFYLYLILAALSWLLGIFGFFEPYKEEIAREKREKEIQQEIQQKETERLERLERINFLDSLENLSLECSPPEIQNPSILYSQPLYIITGDGYDSSSSYAGSPSNKYSSTKLFIRLSKEQDEEDFSYYEIFKVGSNGGKSYDTGDTDASLSQYSLGPITKIYRDSLKLEMIGSSEYRSYSSSLANRGIGNSYGEGYFDITWSFSLISQCNTLETQNIHEYVNKLSSRLSEEHNKMLELKEAEKAKAKSKAEEEQKQKNKI